jgi:hypothetical protein
MMNGGIKFLVIGGRWMESLKKVYIISLYTGNHILLLGQQSLLLMQGSLE